MALQRYSDGFLFLNGILLAELTSFDVEHANNAKEIITIAKGLAGPSPGANMTKIKTNSAVPASGIEYSYLQSLQNTAIVEIVWYAHSKKKLCKGFMTNVREVYGADKASEISVDFTGSPVEETNA